VTVLHVVALRHFGATAAAIVARADARGELLRVGASTDADLRLRGAGDATAELFCDGSTWWVREARDSPRAARDGDALAVGPWTLVVLLCSDDEDGSRECDVGDMPRMSCEGEEVVFPARGVPAILGTGPWCALRLRAVELPAAAVIRRGARRATRLYPVPGVELRCDGERVSRPVDLRDGDRLQAGGARAPIVTFLDPAEQLDRLLGAFGPAPAEEPPAPANRMRRADVTAFEAALWGVAIAGLVGYAALAWVRW
jgi:hypothetical protein